MNIFPIHALADNYIWMIEDTDSVVIVDPGEAAEILSYIEVEKPSQIAILLTHKHDDHIGGVEEIIQAYPETNIYAPSEVPGFDDMTILEDGSQLDILGHTVTDLLSAGHTAGHLAYIVDNQFLFSGDAMFSAGYGRVFTGDFQLADDDLETYKRLDDDIDEYAEHTYSITNYKFA